MQIREILYFFTAIVLGKIFSDIAEAIKENYKAKRIRAEIEREIVKDEEAN